MRLEPAERAQKAAQTAQAIALIALIVTVVLILILYAGATFAAFSGEPRADGLEITRTLAVTWISVLPVGLFLSALSEVRKALAEFAKGRFFAQASARAVRSAGLWAVGAMLAKDIIVPSVKAWTPGAFSPRVSVDAVDFALFAFLVFVAVIGRVLELATELKSENEAFV
jgi:hypothetical protein